jgi:hypothetical protein
LVGGWTRRESGGGVVLAKSRVMSAVSTGESLMIIGWEKEPILLIVFMAYRKIGY